MWQTEYTSSLKIPYKIDIAEKSIMKKLLVEFGYESLEKVVKYYIANYKNIKIIKGAPSIKAMMGFKRSLFPLALTGESEKEITTTQSKTDEEYWNRGKN